MSAMFKAIVWKELRENLKWAVLILLAMATILAIAMHSLAELVGSGGSVHSTAMNGLEATTAIGGILAGLLLGVAQTITENRRDNWGFLIHRPVSRSTLFRGKIAAGVLLYAAATLTPVIGALIWMATPGHLSMPFDWRIALPGIANLLGGLAFYFAGLLTGIRQARWYATRAAGIVASIWFFAGQMVSHEFWQAAAWSAAGFILIGAAAWNSFVKGGEYEPQSKFGRTATGTTVALGIALPLLLALMLSLRGFRTGDTSRAPTDSGYMVTRDGILARVVARSTREDRTTVEISDPEGHPLPQYQHLVGLPLTDARRELYAGLQVFNFSLTRHQTPSFRSIERFFIPLATWSDLNGNEVTWYYAKRARLIAAYSMESGNLVGWMGPDGFSAGRSKPRPFSGSSGHQQRLKPSYSREDRGLLVLDDAVYRLLPKQQNIEKIFQAAPGEALISATPRPWADVVDRNVAATRADAEEAYAIATTQRALLLLRNGTKALEIPQDGKAMAYATLAVYRTMQSPGTPMVLWYRGSMNKQDRVDQIGDTGIVTASHTLPQDYVLPASGGALKLAIGESTIAPLPGAIRRNIAARTYNGTPNTATPTHWPLAILFAILPAIAAFLRGRTYAFQTGRLITWTGIALLLGPLGYLTMLTLLEWPAREPCPSCNKKRVVTRETCEHCNAPFPAPALDGTEIFEPVR